VLVVGLGNEYRSDDGAGPAVAAYVADRASGKVDATVIGEPLDLLGKWDDTGLCVVADATRSGAPPGTVQLVDLGADGDADAAATSTHGMDLARVLRLARVVGGAPRRVVVVGIEGESFADGSRLSETVAAAVAEAGELVLQLVDRDVSCA
jgi:hydrogenase maturation protease